MQIAAGKYAISAFMICLICITDLKAGPPFNTDDPEPVDFRHWEYYISSIDNFEPDIWSGTLPHFEVNYGLVKNVQIHLLLPFNYNYTVHHSTTIGYANTELGIKYRFVQETDNMPQIGTFPIFEIPTVRNSEFSNGKMKVFIPVWIQKSWGKFTTYGGAGYWINPGTGNKNYSFAGLEAQYDLSRIFTLGGEAYYQTPDKIDGKPVAGFNIGGFINFSEKIINAENSGLVDFVFPGDCSRTENYGHDS